MLLPSCSCFHSPEPEYPNAERLRRGRRLKTDNHAKTPEDVAAIYAHFFAESGMVQLTEQDQKDMVAFLKLLR